MLCLKDIQILYGKSCLSLYCHTYCTCANKEFGVRFPYWGVLCSVHDGEQRINHIDMLGPRFYVITYSITLLKCHEWDSILCVVITEDCNATVNSEEVNGTT